MGTGHLLVPSDMKGINHHIRVMLLDEFLSYLVIEYSIILWKVELQVVNLEYCFEFHLPVRT